MPGDPVPDGFKNWTEFNKAKKEKKRLKQEYKIKKLEEQKLREEGLVTPTPKLKKQVCDEPSTLSIAVPGSILENAQSFELRTYLAGQIARAACVYKVDEIIVYDDVGVQDSVSNKTVQSFSDSGETRSTRRCCAQLARILQFLECPQYLRKEFFPMHRDLEYAGLLNPLDAPHHMRQQDDCRFREGVVTVQPAKNGSFVNVGLLQHVKVDKPIQPGVRVTVEMIPSPESKRFHGRVVPPSRPLKECGIYWGYSVRLANSLNAVLTECPYKEGYDVTVGTSERGVPVEKVSFPSHQHSLVVFGGLTGIESALEADDVLTVDDPALIFDHYINTCPNQGSRTIRTEEALLITLAELRTRLQPKVCPKIPENGTQEESDEGNESAISNEDADDNNDEETQELSLSTITKRDDVSTYVLPESSAGVKIKKTLSKNKAFKSDIPPDINVGKISKRKLNEEAHEENDTTIDSTQPENSDDVQQTKSSKKKKKRKRQSSGADDK